MVTCRRTVFVGAEHASAVDGIAGNSAAAFAGIGRFVVVDRACGQTFAAADKVALTGVVGVVFKAFVAFGVGANAAFHASGAFARSGVAVGSFHRNCRTRYAVPRRVCVFPRGTRRRLNAQAVFQRVPAVASRALLPIRAFGAVRGTTIIM